MTEAARRIIHVPRRFVFDEWGGTETVLAELVSQQRRQGWEPEIHTSRALCRTTAGPANVSPGTSLSRS